MTLQGLSMVGKFNPPFPHVKGVAFNVQRAILIFSLNVLNRTFTRLATIHLLYFCYTITTLTILVTILVGLLPFFLDVDYLQMRYCCTVHNIIWFQQPFIWLNFLLLEKNLSLYDKFKVKDENAEESKGEMEWRTTE